MPLGVCSDAAVESAAADSVAASACGSGVAVGSGASVGSGVGVASTTVTTASDAEEFSDYAVEIADLGPCAIKAAPNTKAKIHFFFIVYGSSLYAGTKNQYPAIRPITLSLNIHDYGILCKSFPALLFNTFPVYFKDAELYMDISLSAIPARDLLVQTILLPYLRRSFPVLQYPGQVRRYVFPLL